MPAMSVSIGREIPRIQPIWIAALLSIGASGIHFAVAPAHFDEYWLFGWFFVVAAWLQAVWALSVVGFGPRRDILWAGVAGNTALILFWLWTRVVGVPLGPESGETEAFAWVDAAAVVCEAGVVVLAAVALWSMPRLVSDRRTAAVVAAATLLLAALIGLVLLTADDSEHGHASESEGTEAHE